MFICEFCQTKKGAHLFLIYSTYISTTQILDPYHSSARREGKGEEGHALTACAVTVAVVPQAVVASDVLEEAIGVLNLQGVRPHGLRHCGHALPCMHATRLPLLLPLCQPLCHSLPLPLCRA